MRLASRSVDLLDYSDQQQSMIRLALALFELSLEPARTPTSIAEKGDVVSEGLWELALKQRLSPNEQSFSASRGDGLNLSLISRKKRSNG
jgi:hypothetical protein